MCVLCFTSDRRGTQKLMVKETSNLTCETNFATKTLSEFLVRPMSQRTQYNIHYTASKQLKKKTTIIISVNKICSAV